METNGMRVVCKERFCKDQFCKERFCKECFCKERFCKESFGKAYKSEGMIYRNCLERVY